MKKTESDTLKLEHIQKHHITALAAKAKCDVSYVWMIVNGKRESNSRLAKAIYSAAKSLNDSIEAGLNKANKKFELIEND